jgi:haloalkane dehalogenase
VSYRFPSIFGGALLTIAVLLTGCSSGKINPAADATTTAAADATSSAQLSTPGVVLKHPQYGDILRTPKERFANLSSYPFTAHYIDVDNADDSTLYMHYLDEGPRDGRVVLMMHGNPAWSYLVRDHVKPLVDAGYRVIALDLVGFGKSDKPARREHQTYANQTQWVENFTKKLGLCDTTMFAQDWGAMIGLRAAMSQHDRFSGVVISNGGLSDGSIAEDPAFAQWRDVMSQEMKNFSMALDMGTPTDISEEDKQAYDAPFPTNDYTAGPRQLPAEVPFDPTNAEAITNKEALKKWSQSDLKLSTIFSDPAGPGNARYTPAQQQLIDTAPGAVGQPHVNLDPKSAGHFISEDAPDAVTKHLLAFLSGATSEVAVTEPAVTSAAPAPAVPQAFRDCMSTNGIELPDGALAMPVGADPASLQKAFMACQSELPAGMSPPGIGTPGAAPSTLAAGTPTASVALAAGCAVEPEMRETPAGVKFLRTPDACFEGLPGWNYEPKYVEIDGLRQAYIDEGPADADPILLLHGQPSWSYLYKDMIPGLVASGHRVVAMDHLGMGRSDKPTELSSYSFDDHVKRLDPFTNKLELKIITLFAQDWGSVIGLWDAADHPTKYRRYIIGNGGLPNVYKAFDVPTELTEASKGFSAQIGMIPDRQQPFFDANGKSLLGAGQQTEKGDISGFATWAGFAMYSEEFSPGKFVEALTYKPLQPNVEAAYNAPFPSRAYMSGPRAFPTLLNQLLGRTDAQKAKLTKITAPFLTIFGGNDPGLVGEGDGQPFLTTEMPGAANQPHHRYPDASHFLQADQGADIAKRVNEFIAANPT